MTETYIKLFLALLAGFAITGVSLLVARKLSLFIDSRKSKNRKTDEQEQEDAGSRRQ